MKDPAPIQVKKTSANKMKDRPSELMSSPCLKSPINSIVDAIAGTAIKIKIIFLLSIIFLVDKKAIYKKARTAGRTNILPPSPSKNTELASSRSKIILKFFI